eukprot:1733431-Amphidinium_carterae.1
MVAMVGLRATWLQNAMTQRARLQRRWMYGLKASSNAYRHHSHLPSLGYESRCQYANQDAGSISAASHVACGLHGVCLKANRRGLFPLRHPEEDAT